MGLFALATAMIALQKEMPSGFLLSAAVADGAQDYGAALELSNRSVMAASNRADIQDGIWLAREYQAMALHRRAQLSGNFDDLRAADQLLSAARRNAPHGSGPLMSSALVAFSLHRNAEAETYLEQLDQASVPQRRVLRSEAQALKGDIALYRGDYDTAASLYDRAMKVAPGPGIAIRRANLLQRLGDFDAAIVELEQARHRFGTPTPRMAALYLLYAGGAELKRGRWDEARQYFERAEMQFPGHWLTSAHIAQLDAAEGHHGAAARRYRAILSEKNEPSVMLAYATMLASRGQDVQARRLEQKADAILAQRAEMAPEAFADHLLDSAIGQGDVDAALRHARANHANRPYGDSKVGLARALNLAGQPRQARALLEEVEESGWRSTEQYLALDNACTALGNHLCAARARAKARAFNSKAFDPGADMLAFGNH
ncbi:tetratricopeptide repeat protein [Sphingomicrobium flavum]|uniref:tetratricopeptide repeat protein n=1 Tax=Sphingomicrobium flavum TaxID=1229164 RepID=UPI0021ADA1CB|nr:tetratricopeptide repeat protein [Sphingomicrobium flavum]